MKIILTIIAVAVGMVQTAARAADEPALSLEGRQIVADSCGVDCHCLIGGPPDNGLCKFFVVSQADKGQFGGVKLDGVKFGMAGEFVQTVKGEPPKFTFAAYYIDSGASAEQREALRKVFTNFPMGQPTELKEVPIKFENLDAFGQVGKTVSATVGDIGKVEVTPIRGGGDPNKPIAVENEADPGSTWTALGKASNSFYHSAGKDYKFDGTSGESKRFAWK